LVAVLLFVASLVALVAGLLFAASSVVALVVELLFVASFADVVGR
jgi:hypothetical protein